MFKKTSEPKYVHPLYKIPFPHSMDMHMTEEKKENIQLISVIATQVHSVFTQISA